MACACPSGLQNPKDRGPSNGDRPRSCADPRSLAGEQVGEQVASSLKIGGDHFTVLVGITSPPQIHRIDLVRYDRIQFAHLAPLFHQKCVCVCVCLLTVPQVRCQWIHMDITITSKSQAIMSHRHHSH